MTIITRCLLAFVPLALWSTTAAAQLPAPDSDEFCVAVQKILADTAIDGQNTVFSDMPAYRASKPMVDPLEIFQVVTYQGQMPVMVSCKVKTAAHLRDAFGENAAGKQQYCPEITRRAQAQAVAELQGVDPAAAARAAAFVVDDNEPFMTGRNYLADFQLSFIGDDGKVHFNSPGLYQDYDSWMTWMLPEAFQGQSYCHIPTVAYMKALATGAMEPGTVMTTADDAPVTPQ
ncbi:MAG: hypothetical protein QNJ73_00250 [Gammaproteobacteria bacterium]|nr:hypothetical protein [Gammaproteobacteria bacterium]